MRRISGTWEPAITMLTEKPQVETPRGARVRMRDGRDRTTRISDEVSHKGMEPRRCVEEPDFDEPTSNGRSR